MATRPQPECPSYSQGVDKHPLVSGRWWHQAPGRLAFALQTPSSPPLEPGFGRAGAHGGLGAGWGWAVGGWAVPRLTLRAYSPVLCTLAHLKPTMTLEEAMR